MEPALACSPATAATQRSAYSFDPGSVDPGPSVMPSPTVGAEMTLGDDELWLFEWEKGDLGLGANADVAEQQAAGPSTLAWASPLGQSLPEHAGAAGALLGEPRDPLVDCYAPDNQRAAMVAPAPAGGSAGMSFAVFDARKQDTLAATADSYGTVSVAVAHTPTKTTPVACDSAPDLHTIVRPVPVPVRPVLPVPLLQPARSFYSSSKPTGGAAPSAAALSTRPTGTAATGGAPRGAGAGAGAGAAPGAAAVAAAAAAAAAAALSFPPARGKRGRKDDEDEEEENEDKRQRSSARRPRGTCLLCRKRKQSLRGMPYRKLLRGPRRPPAEPCACNGCCMYLRRHFGSTDPRAHKKCKPTATTQCQNRLAAMQEAMSQAGYDCAFASMDMPELHQTAAGATLPQPAEPTTGNHLLPDLPVVLAGW